MQDQHRVFYAYPSLPPDLGETIESAILEIANGNVVDIRGWRALRVTGKLVISEVLTAIDQCDVLAADLTYLNSNVLFELGYAIAKRKRLWISLNPNIQSAVRDYRRLGPLLSPIGYAPYSNRTQLVQEFYKDQAWTDASGTLFLVPEPPDVTPSAKPQVLYLKSVIPTDASIVLSDTLQNNKEINVTLDDPAEMPSDTLDWYFRSTYRCDAVVAHMLSDRHAGSVWHNSRAALVAGIAVGFNKDLLMLAHAPYEAPFDYQTLLRIHERADQCEAFASNWLDALTQQATERRKRAAEHVIQRSRSLELRQLSIGEVVAEREEDALENYFVETSQYLHALNSEQTLFIGRRGTGKTANLLAIAREVRADVRNLVCVIRPVDYELEGVLRVLRQNIERSERGYLLESLWKFLILTKLAKCILDEIFAKPPHYTRSDDELELLDIYGLHANLINPAFSIRLQAAVESLDNVQHYTSGSEQRTRVSELLHDVFLSRLREALNNVLSSRPRVVLLIDNLDKAWTKQADVEQLSDLLFALLNVTRRVRDEFSRQSLTRRVVNLSLLVFLRSDIFAVVQSLAPERDRLEFERISWTDPELLMSLVEERLSFAGGRTLSAQELWERASTQTIKGQPVRDFFTQNCLPRPRDILQFVKLSLAEAVTRRHSRVEEDDLLSARNRYSEFALGSIVAEDLPHLGQLESILFHFAGASESVARDEVEQTMERAGVSPSDRDRYLELLLDINFLGIEDGLGAYRFPTDEAERRVLHNVARRAAITRGLPGERYGIHPAFRPVLQIQPTQAHLL